MPLPLFLGIAAAVAAAGGIGTGVHGAVKMKGANDTVKSAGERHNKNIQRFESCNSRTAGSMDALGKLELDILASFQQFSDMFEQIQNRPSYTTPITTARVREITTHTIAITDDLRSSFSFLIAMKRMRICGIPQYPSPQARLEMISIGVIA